MATSEGVLLNRKIKFRSTELRLLAACKLFKPLVEDTCEVINVSPPALVTSSSPPAQDVPGGGRDVDLSFRV